MTEILNKCLKLGCVHECCYSPEIEVWPNERVLFPEAREIDEQELQIPKKRGVYITKNPVQNGKYIMQIVNIHCPRLGPLGCTIHDIKPEACLRYEIGSADCNKARDLAGLAPIKPEKI